MFGHRYFGARHFGPRYWGAGGSAAPTQSGVDGSGLRIIRRRPKPLERLPEDYERERRMLEEYLESLAEKTQAIEVAGKAGGARPAAGTAEPRPRAPVVPRLSAAMAKVAGIHELKRIEEAAAARARDRERARKEHERRRQAAVAAVLLMTH